MASSGWILVGKGKKREWRKQNRRQLCVLRAPPLKHLWPSHAHTEESFRSS